MEQDVVWDSPADEQNSAYTLRFTQEEYEAMVREILRGEYSLYVEIVDRILKAKFRKWAARPLIQMFSLEHDLHSEVIMCLIKEARHIVQKDGSIVDPHYFQARVFIVAKGRALNFMDREGYAHGVVAGKRFESLRRELGMEDAADGAYEEQITARRTYIPMISVETGGYSEDGEEVPFEIPREETSFEDIDRVDEMEDLLRRMNDAAVSSGLAPHKVITWFLYVTSLAFSWYNGAVTKAWMEQMFSDKTLCEIVEHIAAHRTIVYTACVTEEQIVRLRVLTEQMTKSGERVGDTRFDSYCMAGKTMRATVSDWINRWNEWFRVKGVQL